MADDAPTETLRAILHRHADELADYFARVGADGARTRRTSAPRPRHTPVRPPVVVDEIPLDDVTKARVNAYLRRKGVPV